MRVLLPQGIDTTALELDTAVAAYVIDPADGQATLDELTPAPGDDRGSGTGGGAARLRTRRG